MATATPAAKSAPTTKKPPAKPPAKKTAPPAKKAPVAKTTAPVKKAAPAKPTATKKTVAKPTSIKPAKPTGVKPPTGTAFAGVEMGSDLLSMTQVWLRHDEIFPSRDNLRETLTDIDDLAASIASVGLLEPLIVTLTNFVADGLCADPGYYVIVAGHRRHAALGVLIGDGRWSADRRIPCVVGDQSGLSDEDRTVQMLIENLQRVDLNPIEEALGYKRLVDAGWKQTRIAETVGRHQNRVSERMQLIRLPEQWRPAIANGEIPLGLAATLTGLTAGATEILTKEKRLPDKNTIDAAIRKDRIDTAVATTKAAAKERGLIYSPNKQSWMMHDHVRELDTTPDKLAKVLLPPDVTGWEVTLETYTDPAKVTVWRRTTPITPAAEPAEITPYDQWQKDCQVARREHQAAIAAFEERQSAVEIEFARTVETKIVAAACMKYVVNDNLDDLAEALGWKRPDVDDDEIIKAHLQEWYGHAANVSAACALELLRLGNYGTPQSFIALRNDYLQAAGLGAEARPSLDLPLAPGITAVDGDEPAADDTDDLIAVSDDDTDEGE